MAQLSISFHQRWKKIGIRRTASALHFRPERAMIAQGKAKRVTRAWPPPWVPFKQYAL
jgi:hypothetical protein